jgi:hypothetical protein
MDRENWSFMYYLDATFEVLKHILRYALRQICIRARKWIKPSVEVQLGLSEERWLAS